MVLAVFTNVIESRALLSLVQSSIIIGIALASTAFIFVRNDTLDPYHAYMILHLAFMSLGPSYIAFSRLGNIGEMGKITLTWTLSVIYWVFLGIFGIRYFLTNTELLAKLESCGWVLVSGSNLAYETLAPLIGVLIPLLIEIGILTKFLAPMSFSDVREYKQRIARIRKCCSDWWKYKQSARLTSERNSFPLRKACDYVAQIVIYLPIAVTSFIFVNMTASRLQSILRQQGIDEQWGFAQVFSVLALMAMVIDLVWETIVGLRK